MSYQKIVLLYGETVDDSEFNNKIIPLIDKELLNGDYDIEDESELEEMDFDDKLECLGLEYYNGYYHDTWKIGINIEDEVRTMQDFVFDFDIPTNEELEKIKKEYNILVEKIGLSVLDFKLGVCTKNY